MLHKKLEEFKGIIDKSNNIVFLGGAGVSTESGIPDFRSHNGIYNQDYPYPPERILSASFFKSHTDVFYDFYREKSLKHIIKAKPNKAHYKLAELEQKGKLSAIVTQNIDGLHQASGSKRVLELHGTAHDNYCVKCGETFNLQYIMKTSGIAHCTCGGMIHPGIVLFEEALDQNILKESIYHITNADALIVAGTSLVVYPAAGLLDYYEGHNLILINKDATGNDGVADLVIHDLVGSVFSTI